MYMGLILLVILSLMDIIITSSINEKKLKNKSLIWSLLILIYYNMMILFLSQFNNFQLDSTTNWMINESNFSWGITLISIDGMSMFFMGLSIMLVPICILISWNSMMQLKKEFLMCLFSILLLLIGVFSMLDMLGFYMLFEMILMPMFLIMGMWGSSEEKVKAAFYFFFYTLMGSLLMLISMFKLYTILGTTSYLNLITINIPNNLQSWLFIGFFMSLAVKMPMIPMHMWLPQAHVEAPVSGSVLLAGMLLKLGGYGFLSFGYPLFPMASEYFSPFMILLSMIAVMYGSFTTCSQTDMKSLMAYSSVAHMGLVTLAIFTHSNEGLFASMSMMMAHGLVSSALFMTSSMVYTSHHSSTIKYYSGLTMTMPMFSIITLMLMLANMGFPLTYNFMAEFFSMLAAFNYSYMMGMSSCMGALMSTVYALYYYNSMYFGNLSKNMKYSSDLTKFEFNSFIPLMLLTLVLGMFPNLLFNEIQMSSFMNISL